MGYSEAEFWHDVQHSNTLYEAGRINLDQRNTQIKGYLSMFENVDKEYHTLKGNGVGTNMYNALMALPTEPPHEKED